MYIAERVAILVEGDFFAIVFRMYIYAEVECTYIYISLNMAFWIFLANLVELNFLLDVLNWPGEFTLHSEKNFSLYLQQKKMDKDICL